MHLWQSRARFAIPKLQQMQQARLSTGFCGVFVEMAGLEPASRTLLDKATTLIFGV